ncbi:hypothetical protein O6P32_06950 [Phocaeicola sp. KGMB11183]|uniref:EpsG family protein n=1 Tax=Phocaeicola acetigenes TaxID=3016083 RepID=A0ABT4PHD0_9BACT|nr:hypothetical protein [Phocaeicola sp. KGMB11183]MCZ8372448.1 hypothetical protein [Phocaeicola sp. KGMB11183]
MIILYFFFLLYLSASIYYTPKNKLKKRIFLVSIAFAILAFFQEVQKDSDLTVAFYHLDILRQKGWNYFSHPDLAQDIYFTGRDILKIYFYILSLLPYNNFYSAISIFFIYFLPLNGILTICQNYQIPYTKTKYLLILLLWMIDFFDGSNGVRNMLSFSIFSYALMKDICIKQNKLLTWGLYIISALLHSSAWILILLRSILYIKKKRIIIAISIMLIVWPIALQYIPFLSGNDNAIMNSMQHHANAYTHTGSDSGNFNSDNFNNSTSYILMRIFRIVHVLLLTYMILYTWKRAKTLPPFYLFMLLLSGFCIGSTSPSIANNVLSRYSFAMIFLTPLTYLIYNQLIKNKKYIIIGNYKIEFFALALIFITILFNYYMFRYHYHYMFFGFNLY